MFSIFRDGLRIGHDVRYEGFWCVPKCLSTLVSDNGITSVTRIKYTYNRSLNISKGLVDELQYNLITIVADLVECREGEPFRKIFH